MAPESYQKTPQVVLTKCYPYRGEIPLQPYEELVEYRLKNTSGPHKGKIMLFPGESWITDAGYRIKFEEELQKGWCKPARTGQGRYIVRKKGTVVSVTKFNPNQPEELEMSEQTLNFKRETLIKALQDRKDELTKQDKEKKDKADAEVKDVREQLVKLMDKHPEFVTKIVEYLNKSSAWGMLKTGTEDFAKSVESWANVRESGPNPDHEVLDRLLRMYEAAEDDQVELAVTDQVVRYL